MLSKGELDQPQRSESEASVRKNHEFEASLNNLVISFIYSYLHIYMKLNYWQTDIAQQQSA